MDDLNASLQTIGSRKTNGIRRQLQELLNEGILNFIDDDSITFERNDYEDKIDWILGSQPLISFISNFQTHSPIGTFTGHKSISFDIPTGPEPKPLSLRTTFSFKRAN